MKNEERFKLIKEVGEEINTEEELKEILEKKEALLAYDGFEPSGEVHIASAVLRAININKMVKAGCKFKILVADWHAWANNKMEGDLDKIQTVGKYFIEVWKAAGVDPDNVEFVWASELVDSEDYWKKVMQIAINSTLNRVTRCSQIMGRSEKDNLSAAQILYPCMQAADIFHLKADICQLGIDQRKVNMLAREVGEKIGFYKPIVVSHHMLMGLQQPVSDETDTVERAIAMKMSKSNPDSAIYVNDSEDEIKRKLKKAYCPEGEVKENPVLEYCKYIIFEKFSEVVIERPEKFGGSLKFDSYTALEEAFVNKELHPMDLKQAAAKYINDIILPIRRHFEENEEAKKLYETVKSYKVTR